MHGTEQEDIRRRYIEERYRLIPYIYTTVEELSRTGVPVVRPLFLEFPRATNDSHPLDLDAANEFLLGPDLLVAPPPFPEQPDNYDSKVAAGYLVRLLDWRENPDRNREKIAEPRSTRPFSRGPIHFRSTSGKAR